jgi:hypothetical protein
MGTATMARKSAKPAAERAKPAAERPAIAVTLRGGPEWKAWIEAGAKFCRTDVAKLIDSAVVDYLKTRGFKQEAPDR